MTPAIDHYDRPETYDGPTVALARHLAKASSNCSLLPKTVPCPGLNRRKNIGSRATDHLVVRDCRSPSHAERRIGNATTLRAVLLDRIRIFGESVLQRVGARSTSALTRNRAANNGWEKAAFGKRISAFVDPLWVDTASRVVRTGRRRPDIRLSTRAANQLRCGCRLPGCTAISPTAMIATMYGRDTPNHVGGFLSFAHRIGFGDALGTLRRRCRVLQQV